MAKDASKKSKDRAPRSYQLTTPNRVQTQVSPRYFNRFATEDDAEFLLLYLGSVIGGELLNCFVVAMSKADLLQAFTISQDYIGALGSVSQEPPKSWSYPRTNQPVTVSNVIELSYAGDVGEINFSTFGIHDLAMVRQGIAHELKSMQLISARSSLALHRQVVGNLFKGL